MGHQTYAANLTSSLTCVDMTTYEQHTGELWSFDNTKPHGALNNTAKDRIHLIFDTQPGHLKAHAEMLKQKYSGALYMNDPNRS